MDSGESRSEPVRHAMRLERDSMGELEVPREASWGAQTQRALQNFPPSGLRMPAPLVHALGLIKAAAALTNRELGDLPADTAVAIHDAGMRVARGELDAQFPLDLFQTGSGTSTNMNLNEVIAFEASRALGKPVGANDDVNMSQSSNDVIPTAIHLSAALMLRTDLAPALEHLSASLGARAVEFANLAKTGRTHLMDAMPITLGQEISGWKAQIDAARERLLAVEPRLHALAQGGTAVGTGINARPGFAPAFARILSSMCALMLSPSANYFAALSSQDTAVELSGQLKVLAVALMKICNDLRWMNSGPQSGLGEIALPALQPGSSIMPGKVNPVIPEAVCMMAAQVIGNDAAITIAGQSGNFQLNVMLPLVAHNLLQSLHLMGVGARTLADRAIAGFTVNAGRIEADLARNPILVTALNPLIGYERGAAIAKRANAEHRGIVDMAAEMTGLSHSELAEALNPLSLTVGGVKGKAIPS